MDTNKDGKISKDEFMDSSLKEAEIIGKIRFNKVDINSDGALAETEITKRFHVIKESLKVLIRVCLY